MSTETEKKKIESKIADDAKPKAERNPDILLYSDLYKNAMMGADSCAKMVGKANDAEDNSADHAEQNTELRQDITKMMEEYAVYAQKAADALANCGVTAEQLTTLEKLPAEIGITMQTMFDKSVSKCAEVMINGITMGIIDMKKARRVCSEDGCSPEAYRLAGDMIAFCERYVEQMKEYL